MSSGSASVADPVTSDVRPELFPDLDKSDWPVYQEVTKDAVYLLTSKAALPLKPMPPNFKNHGNYVTSVAKLGRFLADKAEEAGVYILSETAATKLLVEDRVVKGVRSGDRGRGKDGEELGNFEPGSDVVAKATVLAEGTVGHLSYAAYDYFDLHGADNGISVMTEADSQARHFTGPYERRVLPLIGHNVPQEAPAETVRAIRDLLKTTGG